MTSSSFTDLATLPSQEQVNAAGSEVKDVNSPKALQSETLLRGKKSVEINHNGAVYRLQATRLGKLILTK